MAGVPNPPGEGENPTRRYKWFRPRQAARGYADSGVTANFGTVSLFNDSLGSHYLVVRSFFAGHNSGDNAVLSVSQGVLGTVVAGATQSIVAGDAKLPGALYIATPAAALSAPLISSNSSQDPSLYAGFPLVVLLPGWSLVEQPANGAARMDGFFLWEAIFADELDFMW
jgi:hypothetical protein